MKIVINKSYGGLHLSHKAVLRYFEIKKTDIFWQKGYNSIWYNYYSNADTDDLNNLLDMNYISIESISRDDPVLIQVVKELEIDAHGQASDLKIVEIPDDVDWCIEVDEIKDGEYILEVHRTWS